jgi:hypothetical protein
MRLRFLIRDFVLLETLRTVGGWYVAPFATSAGSGCRLRVIFMYGVWLCLGLRDLGQRKERGNERYLQIFSLQDMGYVLYALLFVSVGALSMRRVRAEVLEDANLIVLMEAKHADGVSFSQQFDIFALDDLDDGDELGDGGRRWGERRRRVRLRIGWDGVEGDGRVSVERGKSMGYPALHLPAWRNPDIGVSMIMVMSH